MLTLTKHPVTPTRGDLILAAIAERAADARLSTVPVRQSAEVTK